MQDTTGGPAAAATEYELKLTAPPDVLDRVFADAGGNAPARRRRLVAVYYDTADRRLRARGAALRVRREGQRFVQALKIARGPFERLEDEVKVAGPSPELGAIGDDAARRALGAVFAEELAPVFVSDVERRTREVTVEDGDGGSGRVELALDHGTLSAGDRREPVAELELELKAGDRRQVFALAERLVDAGATRIVTRNKAERGYGLADGTGPAAAKAAKMRLARGTAVGDALGRVMDGVFAQLWANHAAAFDGSDPEGVHQLRVGVRRLRSALSLFGGVVAPARLAAMKQEARWAMAELGRCRDLDVFATEVLPPVAAGRPNDAALAQLRATAEDARERAYERLREVLASARYTHFLLGLGAWLAGRGWYEEAGTETALRLAEPLGPFADRMLEKRAEAVRKRGKHFEALDSFHRHEVRKTLKKLRYATDFFRDLYPEKAAKPYLKRLSALQDAFGHMNDMAAAEDLLHDVVDGADARLTEARGLVLGWYAHAAGSAEAELVTDWQAFVDTAPFWRER